MCTSASRMGIARSWVVERRGGDGLDVVEPQRSQKNQKIADSSVEVCLVLLDVLHGLNLMETRGDKAAKREIGVLEFTNLEI